MKEFESYFKAERAESLLFLAVGILCLVLAVWFWLSIRKPFYNGMGISLVLVALIQIVVGGTVYFRTPADIQKVRQYVTEDKTKLKSEELPRMEKVMTNFVVYRYVEIGLALLGVFLIFYFKEPGFWKGLGAGLFAQASVMLLLDYFAESRGKAYIAWLQKILE